MPGETIQNLQLLLLLPPGASTLSTSRPWTLVAISLCALCLSTCKEPLPAYQRPPVVFSAQLTPGYALTATENRLHFYVTVKNIYEETLEGFLSIKGQVQFISLADPTAVKTFTISSANIATASWHYSRTGEVAFDAGGTAVFDIAWDLTQRPLTDDRGNDFTTGILSLRPDQECLFIRKRSDPQDFLVQAYVELFDHTGPAVAGNVTYRFCLVSNWVNQRDCPLVTAPCNIVLSGGK